jgi:hypothetical protein
LNHESGDGSLTHSPTKWYNVPIDTTKKQRGITVPRSGRRLSASKTYHVMIRGNERKAIFFDDDDRAYFVSMLADEKPGAEVCRLCVLLNG